jgi:hypothetical protein
MSACGGGGSSDPPPPPPGPTTTDPTLKAVSAPGEFVAQVRTLVAARAAQGRSTTLPAEASPAAVADGSVANLFSTTTRQEEGVDEDDLVKTDGQRIYGFGPPAGGNGSAGLAGVSTVQVHRRNDGDGSLSLAQTITLRDEAPDDYQMADGLQLAPEARRLVALRRGYSLASQPCPPDAICVAIGAVPVGVTTTLDLVGLDGDGSLGATTNVQIQGDLISSRRIGSTLYVVTRHQPYLLAEIAPTQEARDQALANLTASQVLPTVRVDGGAPQPLVAETDCFTQPGNTSTSTAVTTISAIDLGRAGFAAASRCFLGGADAIYLSTHNMYLATTRWAQPTTDGSGRTVFASDNDYATDLHKFALATTGVDYRASGSVAGHFGWNGGNASYWMGEHGGDLRVVTFTGSLGWAVPADANNTTIPPSPATLSVLRENTSTRTLDIVGRLPNAQRPAAIGKPGEQVQAVRFAGERAYVVTFRRTDPLYVLDLANPTDPAQAGELEVTGFSSNLYPLADGLLLGVGREADAQGVTQAVKVALFDVSRADQPAVIATELFGGPLSGTALDTSPHGIAFLQVGDVVRAALPMLTNSGFAPPQPSDRALQRFEIDTSARTLRRLAPVAPPPGDLSNYYHGGERALMLDEHVYYYSLGEFAVAGW